MTMATSFELARTHLLIIAAQIGRKRMSPPTFTIFSVRPTQVDRYGEVRSVLLYAEIRALTSLKWPVIRPYYVTIRSSYTVTFWHTAVENRIATVHGRITTYFNDSTARISAYNNTERMRTRIWPVLFVLGIYGIGRFKLPIFTPHDPHRHPHIQSLPDARTRLNSRSIAQTVKSKAVNNFTIVRP